MRDLLSWNVSLGRWAGVQVRLHFFFLLFVLVALHLSTQDPRDHFLGQALASLGILLASVLAHEFGHCLAAWKVGGAAEQIVVWPLGGLAQVNVTHDPHSEFTTAAAGPLVNLLVCLLGGSVLIVLGHDLLLVLNPFVPPATDTLSWPGALETLFWVNWLLVLVNLLPAYPLDGGRMLRALVWRMLGYRPSVLLVARVAKVTALGLCVLAILVHDKYPFAVLPLALVGLFLFFSAKQEAERLHENDSEDGLFGYDFSQGYTSLEKALAPPRKRGPGPVRKWLESRRAARVIRQQQIEADEERRADEVLARLHAGGFHSLSEDDRALLGRVSARYRNRLR